MTNEFIEFPDKLDEILAIVSNDFLLSSSYHHAHTTKLATWNNAYSSMPYGNERPNKSEIVIPVVKEYLDFQVPGLKAPFLKGSKIISAQASSLGNDGIALMFEKYLNYVHSKKFPAAKFYDKLAKTALRQGTAIVKLGWEYRPVNRFTAIKERKVKIDDIPAEAQSLEDMYAGNTMSAKVVEETEVKKTLKFIINQPTAEVLMHEEVFIAPNAFNAEFSDSDFIIHTYKTNISKLRETGVYSNLDQVFTNILSSASVSAGTQPYSSNNFNDVLPSKIGMSYIDTARQLIDIKEYWGYVDINDDGLVEPILCVVANDSVVIRLELNPYPDGKLPFVGVSFNRNIYGLYGESDAEYLKVFQQQITGIWRGAFNSLMAANNGQKGFPVGFFPTTQDETRKNRGEDYKYDPASGGQVLYDTYHELPSAFYNLTDKLNAEAGYLTGVNPPVGAQVGNAGLSTPTSSMSAAQLRQLSLVRDLAMDVVIPMLTRWAVYAAEFLTVDEWVRIVGEANVVEIPTDSELLELVEFNMDISTLELDQQKLQSLSFLLQTNGPNTLPELQFRQQAKIYDLVNMYDEADFLRNYQPTPDPLQQKMQELQIMEQEAKVQKLMADTEKSKAEAQESVAIIKSKLGAAAYTEALTNLQKVELVNKLQGKKDQFELNKHLAKLSSNERVAQDKINLKSFESQLKHSLEEEKLRLRKSENIFNKRQAEERLAQQTYTNIEKEFTKQQKEQHLYDRLIANPVVKGRE